MIITDMRLYHIQRGNGNENTTISITNSAHRANSNNRDNYNGSMCAKDHR